MKEVGGFFHASEKAAMLRWYHIMRSLDLMSDEELVLLALKQGLV